MKLVFVTIWILLAASCTKENSNNLETIKIGITNGSSFICDSFKVYTRTGETTYCDSLKGVGIKPGSDTLIIWSYANICQTDGTFSFKVFLSNGTEFRKDCGYFTNSYNPNSGFNLNIYSDSLKLNANLK